ncbi:MAG: hypothetical protein AB1782_14735 [Cyanobacteriota bacterium]
MRKILIFSFLIVTLAYLIISIPIVQSQNTAGGIIVWPNVIEMDFSNSKNNFASKSVYVQNKSTKTERIRAYAQGWNMDEYGVQQYLDAPEDTTLSLLFNPKEFELAPGEKQRVRISTKLPEGTDGEYRGIIFFENILPKENILDTKSKNLSVTLSFVTRYGVTVYAYKGNVNRNMVLENLEPQIINDKQYLVTTLRNDGNIHTYVYGDLLFKSSDNSEGVPVKLKKYTLLPGKVQKMMLKVPANILKNGNYKALLRLTYSNINNEEQVTEAETTFNFDKSTFGLTTAKYEKPVDDEEIKLTPENVAEPVKLDKE